MTNAYQKAGVDVTAGYEVVRRIQKQVGATNQNIGRFGGQFALAMGQYENPVLVSSTDGVGTKLMVAFAADAHATIGIDCVAMCVNDIVAQGAKPLYFLDYLAAGQTQPDKIEQIVSGVVAGCQAADMLLIGGETAEMPGMYAEKHYDLAGFAVGIADQAQLITGETIQTGDVLIGIASSGIHSNGYSLVRQIFFEQHGLSVDSHLPELPGQTLGEWLLTPTRIYTQACQSFIEQGFIKGAAHITGGGFIENIPRMLPDNVMAEIQLGTWPSLPIFAALKQYGQLDALEMYNIFNMGIGMVLAVAPEKAAQVLAQLNAEQEQAYRIGSIKPRQENAIELVG
ncbi:MAG: phosphoribosylformylglycinamidine cyclo-ligase [Latilactobacillus curvatus]